MLHSFVYFLGHVTRSCVCVFGGVGVCACVCGCVSVCLSVYISVSVSVSVCLCLCVCASVCVNNIFIYSIHHIL